MAQKFFDFDEILNACNALKYVTEVLGWKPAKGKDCFNIPWRPGSDSGALQIIEKGYKDYVTGETGSLIDIVAWQNYNGDEQEAQEELGEYYQLSPKMTVQEEKKGRGEYLEEKGFERTVTYDYTDFEGEILHQVSRFEHLEHGKEFVQHTPTQPNVRGIETTLYRLPDWHDKPWVCLCEGEKDADTIANLGLPATTNPCGAGAWQERWSELLKGKKIAIIEDNDEAGRERSKYLTLKLQDYCPEIRVVRFSEYPEGGDVTDFCNDAENPREALLERLKVSSPLSEDELKDEDTEWHERKQRAKEANQYELKNYRKQHVEGEEKPRTIPRDINELIEEVHTRFLDFPRRQGPLLFDHDFDTGKIVFIDRQSQLFSWIQRKSKKRVRWGRTEGCVTKEEFFEALRDEAPYYESISYVPDWPERSDVYYAHPPLPEPSKDHSNFWYLVDFFNYATDEDRILIATLLAVPIYYYYGIPTPLWCIDSEQSGAGKTTLATTVANLYSHPPVEIKSRDLARDPQEITKRLVSTEGRQARVVLMDNITGVFDSEELSAFITQPDITGKPPYGRGEESRPNNLTYILTANDATLGDDLAIRSWGIKLKPPQKYSPRWKTNLLNYIEQYRFSIFADLIDILENHQGFSTGPVTRFPEVETTILQSLCKDEEQYELVSKAIIQQRQEANIDSERGSQVEDYLRDKLTENNIDPDQTSVFLRTRLAQQWCSDSLPEHGRNRIIQEVRHLAAQGHITRLDPQTKIWPNNGNCRRRGITWMNVNHSPPDIAMDLRRGEVVLLNQDGTEITSNGKSSF